MKKGQLSFPPELNSLPHIITMVALRIRFNGPFGNGESWRRYRHRETVAMQFSQIAMHTTAVINHASWRAL